jgi:hypothetical protein
MISGAVQSRSRREKPTVQAGGRLRWKSGPRRSRSSGPSTSPSTSTNRALHFLGTSLALAAFAAALTLTPWWLLAAPLAGYGPAWVGHFCFEKNKPATFRHPLWSLRGDLRMYLLLWRDRMDLEIERSRVLYPRGA